MNRARAFLQLLRPNHVLQLELEYQPCIFYLNLFRNPQMKCHQFVPNHYMHSELELIIKLAMILNVKPSS